MNSVSDSQPPEEDLEGPFVFVTGYHLLVSCILILLGITKAAFSYRGFVVLPTTLELIICVFGVLT